MDYEMDISPSPSYFDPEKPLHPREIPPLRLIDSHRKRNSSMSPYRENSASSRLMYDGQTNLHSPVNIALLLENIKYEADSTPSKSRSVSKRRPSFDGTEMVDDSAEEKVSLKMCKHEEDFLADDGDTTFALFASLLDSALRGLMPFPDLILRLEELCRNVSESIRYGSMRHRVVEDKLMRQKAQLLLDEAASWSLLWYLFGTEEISKELILFPSTSRTFGGLPVCRGGSYCTVMPPNCSLSRRPGFQRT